jgi:hypothetical protein
MQVLNSASTAAKLRGLHGADAALLHAFCAAAPVGTLLRVVERAPARDVAFSALRAIRVMHDFAGWTPPMEACADHAALNAILMLSAGVLKPHVACCADTLWPLQILVATLACSAARTRAARRLAAIPAFWPLALAGLQRADNAAAEGRSLYSSVAHASAALLALTLAHAPEAAPEVATLGAPLLAALCASLAAAPADFGAADAIANLVAAAPGTVCEALKFDLQLATLRALCRTAASSGIVAGAVLALGAPADAAPIVAALLPRELRAHLGDAAPAAAAALNALDAARVKRERRAYIAAEVTSAAEDAAAALAAPLPLWRAAQAAPTGRARIALARANATLRALQLRRTRGETATHNAKATVTNGYIAISMHAPPPEYATDVPTGDFAFTVGMHHILGAPELVVLSDLGGDVSAAQSMRIAGRLICGAAGALMAAVCAGEEDERAVGAALCDTADALELPDARIGVFTKSDDDGDDGDDDDEELLSLGPGLVWRFVPLGAAVLSYGAQGAGSCFAATCGRVRATYYADVAGIVPPEAFTLPTLVCSLAACVAAAPAHVARAITDALAGSGGAAEAPPVCACCASAACMLLKCALPGCGKSRVAPAALRKCSACKRVAYCSAEHQRADWARHKRDCTKAAGDS